MARFNRRAHLPRPSIRLLAELVAAGLLAGVLTATPAVAAVEIRASDVSSEQEVQRAAVESQPRIKTLPVTSDESSSVQRKADAYGSISGRVEFYASPNSGNNAVVTAYRKVTSKAGLVSWDLARQEQVFISNSYFKMYVPVGRYRIAFSDRLGENVPQVLPGIETDDPTSAIKGVEEVEVRDDQDGPSIYATLLTAPASISGTISRIDGPGMPETDIRVERYDAGRGSWSRVASKRAYYNPTFAFAGLTSGTYRVSALSLDRVLAVERIIEVRNGRGTGVDLVLSPTPRLSLSGTITGVTPWSISAVRVEVWSNVGSPEDPEWVEFGTEYPDPDGSYTVNVRPGDYGVRFDDSRDWYATEVYGDLLSDEPIWKLEGYELVSVVSTAVVGIDVRLTPTVHPILGSLGAQSGNLPENLDFALEQRDGSGEWQSYDTRVSRYGPGSVELFYYDDLPDGEYRVTVSAGNYWAPVSQEFLVNNGASSFRTLTLARVPTTTIVGTVAAPPRTLHEAFVSAWRQGVEGWEPVGGIAIEDDGTFQLAVPYGNYVLQAGDDDKRLQTQVYDGINVRYGPPSAVGATSMWVGEAQPEPVHFQLSRPVTITGTVSDANGRVGAGIDVLAWDEGAQRFREVASGYTLDDSGRFEFEGMYPGEKYILHIETLEDYLPVWSGWSNGESKQPTRPDSLGVRTVGPTGGDTGDFMLPRQPAVTGTVVEEDGVTPAAGVIVEAYTEVPWPGTLTREESTVTGVDGSYTLFLESGSRYTIRAITHGWERWLGGSIARPARLSTTNSFNFADVDYRVAELALGELPSSLGAVAGQKLDYCAGATLPPSDDGSSGEVDLPFTVDYFGSTYSSLYVNTNGSVTFGAPLAKFTPTTLTADTGVPIIAPFLADADTTNIASRLVSYGSSPDGSTFCVNWAEVGYYENKADDRNTFQLLLSRPSSLDEGDFDITFNYDQIAWQAGDYSYQNPGLRAAAGLSAGTGAAGTFYELPGSREEEAFLDHGSRALIHGRKDSSQNGRYIIPMRGGALSVVQVATPVVTGSPVVGSKMVANAPAPSGAAVTGQWHRVNSKKVSTPISGATAFAYSVTGADAGFALTFTATTTQPGYSASKLTSAQTASVVRVLTATPTPKITGTAKVGKTLKVTTGSWKPTAVRLSYQWFANGKAISGAKSSKIKIAKKYKKAKISLTVTGKKTGYLTVVTRSAATNAVK